MNKLKQVNITSTVQPIKIEKSKPVANDSFGNVLEAPEGLFDNCDNFKPWERTKKF